MDNLLDLYSYLVANRELKNSLVSNESKFINNEELLLSGLGIIKNLIGKTLLLDKNFLINNFLNNVYNEFAFIDKYLINSLGQINGYLVYDILYLKYDEMLNEYKAILML